MPITLVIHGGAGNITSSMMNKEQEAKENEQKRLMAKCYEIYAPAGGAVKSVATRFGF